MKKRLTKIPKPRNPMIEVMRTRKSGSHGKTKKAQRRADKVNLRKDFG